MILNVTTMISIKYYIIIFIKRIFYLSSKNPDDCTTSKNYPHGNFRRENKLQWDKIWIMHRPVHQHTVQPASRNVLYGKASLKTHPMWKQGYSHKWVYPTTRWYHINKWCHKGNYNQSNNSSNKIKRNIFINSKTLQLQIWFPKWNYRIKKNSILYKYLLKYNHPITS